MKKSYPVRLRFLFSFLLLLCLGSEFTVSAQQVTYGNEWINYNQKYYKIQVPATGIYRLDKSYLQAAGINDVDPRKLQLFRRGQEVSIYVNGQNDGTFDASDYIEFYGEKNDGVLDRELYKDPSLQLNPYYSLYTDTAAYFLTWSEVDGKRMVEYDQNPAGLTSQTWHLKDTVRFDNGQYTRGRRYGENYMSWMDVGEGFTGGATAGFTWTLSALAPNVHREGSTPKVEVALVGANTNTHQIDVFVQPPNGSERLIGTLTTSNYNPVKQELSLAATDFFTDGKLVLRLTAKNSASRFRAVYFRAVFSQRNILTSSGLSFRVNPAMSAPSFFVFEGNSAVNAIGYDVTALNNIKRIPNKVSGTQNGFVYPSNSEKAFIWNGAGVVPLPAKEINFRSLASNKSNYLIISNRFLMRAGGGYSNPVREFASYRASAAGGGYDTLVMEVGQIYDQFFYGDKSSAAIRRFMKYMIANGKPEYLFIIGKGLEADNVNVRMNPSALAVKDLVPTGGTPGSDVFFTCNWEQDQYVPQVATGRIPANTPADVAAYLDKAKVHVTLAPNLEWRKNILHLGGSESVFTTYLRGFSTIAESPLLGAKVSLKSKNLVGGVDTLNVSKELNAGLSLITFFGHSSTSVSELDIGLVSNALLGYNNPGKYPLLLMNGCNAGNSFITDKSFGEDWLLTPNKGAIAFVAHANYGYPSLLNVFSSSFYKTVFADSAYYGKTVGSQHRRSLQLTYESIGGDNTIAMEMQMILQGDPAVILVGPEKPDYVLTPNAIQLKSVDGRRVTANSSKFSISLDIKNLGKVSTDSFYVSVKRQVGNGQTVIYDSLLTPPVYNRDTLVFELDAKVADGSGTNQFEVTLDHTNKIAELDERNNTATFEFLMPKSGVVALAPQEYGIVKSDKVTLVGQSTDLLATNRSYIFEVDTLYTFNSAAKQSRIVKAGTVPSWEVDLRDIGVKDSTTVYWRFRYNENLSQEDTSWATSSFRYISTSSSGWSQVFQGQFDKATTSNLEINFEQKNIQFGPIFKSIEIKGGGGGLAMTNNSPFGIFIDGIKYMHENCGYATPNMYAMVYNNTTLSYYTGITNTGPAGYRCGTAPFIVYRFGDLRKVEDQNRLETFLNSVPAGYHVAILGANTVPYTAFKASLKNAFKSIGSSLIDKLQDGDPFGIIGQKGSAPGTATEAGPTSSGDVARNMQTIVLDKFITGKGSQGVLTSSMVGPATRWGMLTHQLKLESSDSYQLDVIGVNARMEEVMLFVDVKEKNLALSSVNASDFPYIKLQLTLKDPNQRTAPQIKEWTVLFDGVPEGILRPDLIGVEKYTTLSEQAAKGSIDLLFAFQNITGINFGNSDSLTVQTTIYQGNGGQISKSFKVSPLLQNDTIYFNHAFSTTGMLGANRLVVNVNPRLLPEQSYLNNTLEVPFTIGSFTGMPPTLDVAFDGAHILDGDIVSPSPVISMLLKDKNSSLPVTDPASMDVFIKKPGGAFEKLTVASDPDIRWYPATDKEDFRVEYNPKNLPNGTYTLQVQGKNALGKSAGDTPYEINFEVVNESTITNFYPYPNPFSSKTRFVFTLTGSTIPERMKIQIMTVTGKVIREIQKEELGPIRIGNNVSEFAWDGTDEYGDKLANGVYLYRVIMDKGPDEFKHRNTSADKAFKNGYGKMYILR